MLASTLSQLQGRSSRLHCLPKIWKMLSEPPAHCCPHSCASSTPWNNECRHAEASPTGLEDLRGAFLMNELANCHWIFGNGEADEAACSQGAFSSTGPQIFARPFFGSWDQSFCSSKGCHASYLGVPFPLWSIAGMVFTLYTPAGFSSSSRPLTGTLSQLERAELPFQPPQYNHDEQLSPLW
jgi:hypothetical protein